MPRRHENLTRHNILLAAGDLTWLQETYPTIGAAGIIRALIEKHRREIEQRVNLEAPIETLSSMRQL